jgi:N-methylhydantoinase A
MQSSGGIISARSPRSEPVRTVLSGPAGGVIGACRIALAGFDRIIGFDMGGTSTDVFLADAPPAAQLTRESVVAGVPIGVPMLDIHTAGAGGGSIARFDAGGMLRVGPESAGADPGPICFGRGTQPTVTDANLLLGRLDAELPRRQRHARSRDRAQSKSWTTQKGPLPTASRLRRRHPARRRNQHGEGHPRHLRRARPRPARLHAGCLRRRRPAARLRPGPRAAHPHRARPAMPGALSAVGILLADTVRDYSRTVMLPGDRWKTRRLFAELEARGRQSSRRRPSRVARQRSTSAIAARATN